MKSRCIAVIALLALCVLILGASIQMPPVAPHPAAADAWILDVTPVPPVGVIH